MKITILAIGKTNINFVNEGISEYLKRLKRYIKVEIQIIADVKNSKNLTAPQLIQKEEELLLNALSSDSYVVLLDEKGKECTSVELSQFVEGKMISGTKEVVFVIGGAYGVSNAIKQRANEQLSMSQLTFSHQMIRLILIEQIYRAMTIIRGEPYHHE
ncbi:23S rRNA (pseudouridine(1915)-N(3))-methyltransferase RlmH [Perlabentimonas gracilis]|uniref:23S rRNA (pseudouridine(1915)-N(3))-methyltransferase RlmH n=1 Tax=Perlabentimonas gracilis TaxID=2715279 RepID=UPI001408F1FA|nr:23S rRNA (pseudouridine(1915)-N(3))-methyltransferase RlmH [Perlabentimonas gracilis]NHB69698.1 23S rRNA (pseudouridine(1915)-N(3))-methyltransferase RlmH [Perlabentimonas gracilis]